ncbi:hypothetical protein BDZ89DRAFT_1141574 [Hymenopellis radicata]|nr:hypothetical protein BDZ89DRAFT_1141574 [Hymenopellis radicata]
MRKLYKIQFAVSPNPDISFGLDLAQLHRILASRLPQNLEQKRPKFQFVQDLDTVDWSDGTHCICRGHTLYLLNYATIECEGCAKMYHAGCVFFPQDQNSTTRKEFICPLCCLRKGTKYAYAEVRVLDTSANAPVALAEVYVNTEAMLEQCSQLILYMNLPPVRKATVFVELKKKNDIPASTTCAPSHTLQSTTAVDGLNVTCESRASGPWWVSNTGPVMEASIRLRATIAPCPEEHDVRHIKARRF